MRTIKILFVLVLLLELNKNSAGSGQKLIIQKDLSEHCRRRVVPSIFLGRHVVEANAALLQFSRLELPYSCFISIRTESGSNMVMVIQLTPDELATACSQNSEQLLVYEMGETFGGYWGPLPDTVMKRDPLSLKVYTLKTSHPSTTSETSSTFKEETEITEQTESNKNKTSEKTTVDYIEMEIPLLNVSVHLEPSNAGKGSVGTKESFNMRKDVTSIRGIEFGKRVLPSVQFHPLKQPGNRWNDKEEPPKYDLDIVQEFTPDIRLTLPPFNPTFKRRNSNQKKRYQVSKYPNFKKRRTLFPHRHHHGRTIREKITRRMNDATKYTFPTTKITDDKIKHTQESWEAINELIKKLDKTKDQDKIKDKGKTTLSVDDAMLLDRLSEMDHNSSAYLSPNLSIIGNHYVKYKSTNSENHSTSELPSLPVQTVKNYHIIENTVIERMIEMTSPILVEDLTLYNETFENPELATENSLPKEMLTEQTQLTVAFPSRKTNFMSSQLRNQTEKDNYSQNITVSETRGISGTVTVKTNVFKKSTKDGFISIKNKKKIMTGSMVGHESWENVVQAAPEMAELLNQTNVAPYYDGDSTKELKETLHKNELLKRKKRDIHSIGIENARPHNLAIKKTPPTTTQASSEVANMQDFAQLFELQDVEVQGRVTLSYLRQYVGPALFNLCDLDENTIRHVHLFNSSRIVLAITNFTLERMLVILTVARTLLNGELRCPETQLECQVAGARVCLDSMAACDGVPNCGSYDIYDEDRLLCGSSVMLQRNVYLAAFTFLAALLTLLYSVHYWLKRCVPKVADAFFIYTNGVENVLYLDTIMRQPNDINGEEPKMVYHSRMYEDENMYDEELAEPNKTAYQRFLQMLCICFRKKQKKLENADTHLSKALSKRMYSFTELEIRKMISTSNEMAVQTGDSLEMNFLENFNTFASLSKPEVKSAATCYDLSLMIQDSLLTLEEPLPEDHKDELSLLKFFNDARIDSNASTFKRIPNTKPQENIIESNEKEIRSHTYDRPSLEQPGPSRQKELETSYVIPSGSVGKHLRFHDVTTTIPSVEYDDDECGSTVDSRRSVILGESSWRGLRHLATIEEADEQLGGGKEHRHFWGTITGRKSKKKSFFSTK